MDTMQWMVMGLAALTCGAGGACAGRWWSSRRVTDLLVRLDKLEKARQVAGQHAAQARRQIEQLQKDIAAQHKVRAEARTMRKRELSDALDASDQTVRLERSDRRAHEEPATRPVHGFADTLPMA
jgi:hypothetical protein